MGTINEPVGINSGVDRMFNRGLARTERPKTDGNEGLRVLKVLANAEKALLQYYGENLEK